MISKLIALTHSLLIMRPHHGARTPICLEGNNCHCRHLAYPCRVIMIVDVVLYVLLLIISIVIDTFSIIVFVIVILIHPITIPGVIVTLHYCHYCCHCHSW